MQFFPKGHTLAKEGDVEQSLFILIKGRIGIFKGDIKIAEFSQKGTIMGEMSIILNEPRTADIKTLEDSHVAIINAGLKDLITDHPEISEKLMKTLAQRLNKTTKDYWTLAEKVNYLADVKYV